MSEDMSDLMNNLSNMFKNNEIPSEIMDFVNNLKSSESTDCSDSSNSNCKNNNSNSTEPFPDIDIKTILKLKSVMDSMKNTKDDPRSNLLMSLKPYLRENKREKVDQYVKLLSMSKLFEVINPLDGVGGLGNIFGGENKK